jgi:gliding motility-associated lipoprotein GldH
MHKKGNLIIEENPITINKKALMLNNIIILFASVLVIGCSAPPAFENYQEIVDETWSLEDTIVSNFPILDTLQSYNFFVNLRNNNNYNYSNLYVFIYTSFPNGKNMTDTVECVLAHPDGRWIGSGFGSVYDNRIMYKYKKRFPLTGEYQVRIIHAMREKELPGIMDVGFRLEKTTN